MNGSFEALTAPKGKHDANTIVGDSRGAVYILCIRNCYISLYTGESSPQAKAADAIG